MSKNKDGDKDASVRMEATILLIDYLFEEIKKGQPQSKNVILGQFVGNEYPKILNDHSISDETRNRLIAHLETLVAELRK